MSWENIKALTDDFRYMQEKDLDVLVMISGQKGMGKSNTALAVGYKYFREFGLKCGDCNRTYITTINLIQDKELRELKDKLKEENDEVEKQKIIAEYNYQIEKKKFEPCPYCRVKHLKECGEIDKELSEGDALLLLTRLERIPYDPKIHNIRRVTTDDYKHFVKSSIAYDNEDIRDKIYNLAPYSVVLADEGLRFLMASDWARTENKELKKIVGQCRTKHLIFLICIPSFTWVDKKYRNDMCNYWIRLVTRGTAIISIPNLGELEDPWGLKFFSDQLGNYNHLSTAEEIEQKIKKLLKHPNVRDRINIPKVSNDLYDYYLTFRDVNVLKKAKLQENKFEDTIKKDIVVIYNIRKQFKKIINWNKKPTYQQLTELYLDPITKRILITDNVLRQYVSKLQRESKDEPETDSE